MSDIILQTHKEISIRIGTIGSERQPIIVVDNFVADAEKLINYLIENETLQVTKGLYPGLRAETPAVYMELMRAALGEIICSTFKILPQNVDYLESFFSIVATQREELKLPQRIPHIDGTNPNDIAFLHYLCDEKYGGTSFYRHRSTGHEFVNQDRFHRYIKTLENEIALAGLPTPPQYMNGDTALFERICSVKAKFNRLIIYRGTSLHSGDISPDYPFNIDPRTGRLTVTSFLYSRI